MVAARIRKPSSDRESKGRTTSTKEATSQATSINFEPRVHGMQRPPCPCGGGCPTCRQRPFGDRISPAKDYRSRFSGNVAKTVCDVAVHPEDVINFQLKKSFRTVGTGTPKVVVLNEQMKQEYPCVFEAVMAHEQVHIENSTPNCTAFKECVDDSSSAFLGYFGDPTISHSDFVACNNAHNAGIFPDCKTDEAAAYEAGIKKAQALKSESGCSSEVWALDQAITQWQGHQKSPPNCP